MQTLTLTEYGLFAGKYSERVVIKKGKETVAEHPLIDLEQILVAGKGITLSSDLIAECTERGIPITFVDFSGKPYAKLVSPALTATVKTRREQLMAYHDERSVEIAKRFATGKIRNQINLLRYAGKYRKARQPQAFQALEALTGEMHTLLKQLNELQAPHIDEVRPALLNLEGRAGALYWEGIRLILPKGLFQQRTGRGANDPVNSLLNYGYGILYSQVWTALTLAGLEPFAGFLHADRPGKPSLVLDFIEEFRQPVVDRVVIALLNKGFQIGWECPNEEELAEQHIAKPDTRTEPGQEEQRRMSAETRKTFAQKILARLDEPEPYQRKRHKLKNIIQAQARRLAVFLRRESDYQPFISRW